MIQLRCDHYVDDHLMVCESPASLVNAFVSNDKFRVIARCAEHAAAIRGRSIFDSLYEGVWLPPLLWTYHRIVLYSERHLELECALGGRQ